VATGRAARRSSGVSGSPMIQLAISTPKSGLSVRVAYTAQA
jgi:hypothetical protein